MMTANQCVDRTRRNARARNNAWVRATALWLTRRGLRPNHVSIASMMFSALTAGGLLLTAQVGRSWAVALFVLAAICIPFRGLCNLCDGLMAVEGGMKTKSGMIFNDMPDRISDTVVLVTAGYSVADSSWGGDLGWAAALLAVMTAYVRVLGGAAGVSQYFCGPMAKSSRMYIMIAACLMAALELAQRWPSRAMEIALGLIVVGGVVTVARRTRCILRELEGV